MQLIVDAEDIDIARNMSTIEHESLNEKFLASKVIEHLADDNSNGNKENIQTKDNIITEEEEDVVDTDKDIAASADVTLTDDLNKDNIKELNGTKTENAESLDVVGEDSEKNSCKGDPEPICDSKIIEKEIEEKSQALTNNVVIDEIQIEVTNEQKTGENLEKDTNENKLNENSEANLQKEKQEENSTEKTNGDDETNLQDTVDEPLIINEAKNEEPIKVADKEGIEADETAEAIAENDLQAEPNQDIVPSVEPDTKENKVESSEATTDSCIASNSDILDTTEPDNAIEIDDEDAKTNKSDIESNITTEKDVAIEIDDEEVKINEESITIQNTQKDDESVDDKNETKVNDESISLQKDPSSEIPQNDSTSETPQKETSEPKRFCKLSNNLDIFSDEEEDSTETSTVEPPKESTPPLPEKQCISLDDDDDIMVIDEDPNVKDKTVDETPKDNELDTNESSSEKVTTTQETFSETIQAMDTNENNAKEETSPSQTDTVEVQEPENETQEKPQPAETTEIPEKVEEAKAKSKKPLLPKNFIKTYKKNLADMTRDDLEEFCILKIVESIVDRSNLGEIKSQLKNLTQTMEECKKKCLMLTKQNKDLQVVLKSVQEEQKSASDVHITPLKITRSVGMQVVMMIDKNKSRAKTANGVSPTVSAGVSTPSNKSVKPPNNAQNNNKITKEKTTKNQQIPVPRLVPAVPAVKNSLTSTNSTSPKQISNNATLNGVRPAPVSKAAEKRPRSQSVTVDLTDDEPPTKMQPVQRSSINHPVRVAPVPATNILASRYTANMNSPRKVYIPIGAPQGQNVRPGQTIMLKAVTGLPRQRCPPPHLAKIPQVASPVRLGRIPPNRHPAPLPEVPQQYHAPGWKNLPPAPDLKLSKVENGIVISWKIENYQEENHEEIASYQLYAYQETQSPPSTALWKKIGDVKALPLPMACTLTQFMAGFKYYFAVRAVDIKSRFGPFSLPGSILLLNKM